MLIRKHELAGEVKILEYIYGHQVLSYLNGHLLLDSFEGDAFFFSLFWGVLRRT